ncbi:hypothetical protein GCM10022225_82610 [Plantactinospora mayteni]
MHVLGGVALAQEHVAGFEAYGDSGALHPVPLVLREMSDESGLTVIVHAQNVSPTVETGGGGGPAALPGMGGSASSPLATSRASD